MRKAIKKIFLYGPYLTDILIDSIPILHIVETIDVIDLEDQDFGKYTRSAPNGLTKAPQNLPAQVLTCNSEVILLKATVNLFLLN